MEQEFVSPLMDYVFSLLFGDRRNVGVLTGFLQSLLDIPDTEYEKITFDNPTIKRLFRKDKSGIVDVRVTTKSGRILHIELQVEKTRQMKSRVLFYMTRLLWEQLKRGEEYDAMHQVISIVICDHVLLEDETSYFNVFELQNSRKNRFTDLLKLIILELPKVPDQEEQRPVWPWLQFLKCKSREDLEMLTKKHPEVKEAVAVIRKLSWGEKRRRIKEEEALWRTDRRIMREEAVAEGLAEGKAEGLAEGKAIGLAEGKETGFAEGSRQKQTEIARKLKALGLSAEQIASSTGLPLETIDLLNNPAGYP
jgi:predicted transposase/invertase (TIGR01784 family)